MEALRKLALRHPDTEEGVACEGTSVERSTVKARKKAFLFVGATDAMVKLSASLPEAMRLSRKEPGAYHVGANGWVKATIGDAGNAPLELLSRWVDESYQLAMSPSGAEKPARAAPKAADKAPRKPVKNARK